MVAILVALVLLFAGVAVIYLLLKNMTEEGIDIAAPGSCRRGRCGVPSREGRLSGTTAYSPFRPQPGSRCYVSISAGGAPSDMVEWPVFSEQIYDCSPTTQP